MSTQSYQDKLLSKINSINAKLDELFFHMDDNSYDDNKAYVFYEHLSQIDLLLKRINEINNSGR
jgi:hypothetical protein